MEDTVEQTSQVPVCCFVVAIGIFSCCSVCLSQEKEIESAKRQPFVVKLENPSFSTVQATVDIGSIERGKTTVVPLRFESNLGGDVTFKTVVVQCACTGAKIPDGIIKVGQSVDGEVGLAVAKNDRSLSKVFSMEIKTAGSIDRVLIDLKASISGVVAFSQELYTVSIDSSKPQEEEKITLSLPVIASLDMKLEGIAVSVSGALFEKAGKSITAEYKTLSDPQLMKGAVGSVVVQIQSIAILSDSEYLTVQIEGCSFPSETAQIAIRKKLPVSLIPESLFFSSTDLENIQAIGLIRIRQLIVQLPVDVSDMKVLDHSSVDLDPSLQSLTFSIVERNGKAFVEAKGPSDLIAATRVSGKVRLKVNDKVVSETTLVIKKRTDIELLPDYVTLKFDPVNKEFRGELIAKLLIGSVRIEDVRIEAEHIDDIPIELSVGKMSSSTGRVYLSVKGAVSPKDQDQILFRISSPLKTEEQVLRIKVVR